MLLSRVQFVSSLIVIAVTFIHLSFTAKFTHAAVDGVLAGVVVTEEDKNVVNATPSSSSLQPVASAGLYSSPAITPGRKVSDVAVVSLIVSSSIFPLHMVFNITLVVQ